ncbi:MAG TPA: hypothetical protein VN366_01995 [Feifaniaceae bacterium]|nr:hypothetical protein [Feifaniaceae bacterium]
MDYEGFPAEEQAFLNDHGGDRELEQARWVLLRLSKEHGIPLDAVRGALLHTHIRLEARRIAEDAERLRGLMEYAARSDIPPDETDYLGMSAGEFRACERQIREAAQYRRG